MSHLASWHASVSVFSIQYVTFSVDVIFLYSSYKAVGCDANVLFFSASDNHHGFVFFSHPAGGFYSQRVKPGLRVISLNTILYYGPDKVTCNMTDPAGQYEWLEKTLEKAAQSQEKV